MPTPFSRRAKWREGGEAKSDSGSADCLCQRERGGSGGVESSRGSTHGSELELLVDLNLVQFLF